MQTRRYPIICALLSDATPHTVRDEQHDSGFLVKCVDVRMMETTLDAFPDAAHAVAK